MLVISRKKNESLVIADSIEITIVDIRGDKVRIGVTCPAEIPVHRREIYDVIRRTSSSQSTTAAPATFTPPCAPANSSKLSEPAALMLSGQDVVRLDTLRAAGGLSRETAIGAMLEIIDRAGVDNLCDLERRLECPNSV